MKRFSLYILPFVLFCFACDKEGTGHSSGTKIEIYLFKNYPGAIGRCKIDTAFAKPEEEPLIKNSDILNYDQSEYSYTLTDAAINRLKSLTDGEPLALMVNNNLIYYFVNKPAYSSSTCFEHITMDYILNGKLTMTLGYPSPGVPGPPDQRNDPILINALRSQRKLR